MKSGSDENVKKSNAFSVSINLHIFIADRNSRDHTFLNVDLLLLSPN